MENIVIRRMELNQDDIFKYKEIRLNFLRYDGEDSYYTYEETKKWNTDTFIRYYKNNFHSNLEYDFLAVVENIDTNEFVWMWWIRNMWYNKKHILYMQNIYLKPEYRSKWIGSKLLNFIMDNININWIEKIKLDVLSTNRIAKSIYDKLWFETIWILKKDVYYDGKYYDNIIMEKYL